MNINSVKRVFASVRSIINLNIREYGLDGTNAFSGTYMPDSVDAPKRKPIPDEILKVIQSKCQITDDEPRWLMDLISDTGMGLSEVAGLFKDDIHLDEEVPYADIKPHLSRRLKTAGSHRKVPFGWGCLCGQLKRLMQPVSAPFCFQDIVMRRSAIPTQQVLL